MCHPAPQTEAMNASCKILQLYMLSPQQCDLTVLARLESLWPKTILEFDQDRHVRSSPGIRGDKG